VRSAAQIHLVNMAVARAKRAANTLLGKSSQRKINLAPPCPVCTRPFVTLLNGLSNQPQNRNEEKNMDSNTSTTAGLLLRQPRLGTMLLLQRRNSAYPKKRRMPNGVRKVAQSGLV
jgi:hypothetical protein